MQSDTQINWHYDSRPDPLLGADATSSEKMLAYGSAIIFTALLAGALFLGQQLSWAWWQWIVFAVLVFDVAGGVTANALNSCKRFYLSPLSSQDAGFLRWAKNHWVFSGLHIHSIVVAFMFPAGIIWAGILWYVLMLVAVGVTLAAPLYLRRPVAFSLCVLAMLMSLYIVPNTPGFEWLPALLFLKIVYGHTVREEPYAGG